jgi:hypothetical protein
MTRQPFAPRDTVCPKYVAERASRPSYLWMEFCETVTQCFEKYVNGKRQWFIRTLCGKDDRPAADWVKLTVKATEIEHNGNPCLRFEYSLPAEYRKHKEASAT